MSQTRSDSGDPRPLPIVLGVVVSLLGIGAMVAVALVAPSLLETVGFRGFLILCEALLLLPAAFALLAWRPATWDRAMGVRRPAPPTLLVCTGLGGTLWVASLGLLELQYAVWQPAAGYIEGFRRLHDMLRPSGPLDALYSVVAIAIVPALCEEALIRGVLLPSLRTRLDAPVAILLSSLLFAFMHDAYRMPFTFAVGLALGALRLRTGSLLSSLVAHAGLNTLTFAIAPFLDDPTGPLPDPRPLLGLLLLALGAVAGTFLWSRLPPRDPDDQGAPGRQVNGQPSLHR